MSNKEYRILSGKMKVLSPAKINLFLQVNGKRPDGYHELVTLMSCIDLYDVMSFDLETTGISVRCDHPDVPDGQDNLAFKAATLFYDNLPPRAMRNNASGNHGGLSISIQKHIPVAAGLGGGSSNAGQTLMHLNRMHGNPFGMPEMNRMALAIGADVPFFLQGTPAIATGIGEQLAAYHGLASLCILVVCPDIAVSTAGVYKKLNLGLTKCKKQLKNFLFDMPVFDAKQHLCNDLEAVTVTEYPFISGIKSQLIDRGADAALMTGSGPAVFGIFSDSRKARRARERLRVQDGMHMFVAQTLN
jgi:4-diphosphocytidyl-2-C-methyl-D-erythritol kinase